MTAPAFGTRRAGARLVATLAIALLLASCASTGSGGVRTPQDLPIRQVIARAAPAVVGVGSDGRVGGTGFRIEGTRYIATAAHVVASIRGAVQITAGGRRWPARTVRIDESSDVAILEIGPGVPIAGLRLADASPIEAGDWIVVLGCPFGAGPTATTGIVSALPGALLDPPALKRWIQLNAAVNPGNSGGPVLNLRGEVIGIANATIPGGFGLGFAIPVQAVRAALNGTPHAP